MCQRSEVETLEPGCLQVERLPSGRRFLLRDLNMTLDGEPFTIPAGFDTDYSSWPRFLPGPNYQKIDVCGVVHDYCFRFATLGEDGRAVTYVESNRIWYRIARAGTPETRCPWAWAWLGRIGLFLGGWVTWARFRHDYGW